MIKLYSYFRSSSSYRVRLALNLKKVEYEIVPVHLLKDGGEQYLPPFSGLNPSHRIPVLEHDGHNISQSMAIIEYVDQVFKGPQLFPSSPLEKAKALQLCEIINSDIQPLQNLSVLKKLVGEYGFTEDQKVKWIRHWIKTGFDAFEEVVSKTAGQYCMGDAPSAVDCFLVPQVYNAIRFEVDMSGYPNINRANKNCLEREDFKQAHPGNQPDTPKEN